MILEYHLPSEVISAIFSRQTNLNTIKQLSAFIQARDREGESIDYDLLNVIANNMRDDGGALDVENLSIEDIKFNYISGRGRIYVSYTYNRFFGCDDISDNGEDEDDFKIFIDRKNSKIFFEYFVAPAREPDEY